MKKIKEMFLLITVIVLNLLCFTGCDKEQPSYEVVDHISSIEVTGATQTRDLEIDAFAHIVFLEYFKGTDISNMGVKLNLLAGVNMVEPETNEFNCDLSEKVYFNLKSGTKQTRYRFEVGFVKDSIPAVYEGWGLCNDFGELPSDIVLYKSTGKFFEKEAVAYAVVADMKEAAVFDVLGAKTGLKTLTEFYEEKNAPIIMNAGYFWLENTVSLLYRDKTMISYNDGIVWRSNGIADGIEFYPTRAAFSQKENNTFMAEWVYSTAETTYSYSIPAPNKSGQLPLQAPNATWPSEATTWKATTAIGGGPVLIKSGEYQNTWEAELFGVPSGVGPNVNNPRSAIGVTKNNKLVFFVCEGRNMTPNVPGFTLEEVANILLDLGCVEAINLDGGGSSCLLVNGKETIKPSSDGVQRAVVTAVSIQ